MSSWCCSQGHRSPPTTHTHTHTCHDITSSVLCILHYMRDNINGSFYLHIWVTWPLRLAHQPFCPTDCTDMEIVSNKYKKHWKPKQCKSGGGQQGNCQFWGWVWICFWWRSHGGQTWLFLQQIMGCIVFNVIVFIKSWKQMSKTTGGEKTWTNKSISPQNSPIFP